MELLPEEFRSLQKLEGTLVSKRIFLKKVVIMPKGQAPKIKGTICNVPVEDAETSCYTLPRPADSNGFIIVKVKRKLEQRGHVLFEPVRPEFVRSFLSYLKHNNHLYNSIDINLINIPQSMLQFGNSEAEVSLGDFLVDLHQSLEIYTEQQQELEKEESDSLLDRNRSAADETVLISENQSAAGREELTIAPGENKKIVSFLSDQYCEELAHSHLFPTDKFGYKVKREI